MVQAEEPEEAWYRPVGQLAHAFVDAPVVARYVPAAQLAQNEDPVKDWYCPVAQSRQTEAPAPAAYFPVGQLTQTWVEEPVETSEVPAAHATQPAEATEVW
jgi:hypothetical protein